MKTYKTLLSLEAFLTLVTTFLLIPLFQNGFDAIMQASGYAYLTSKNIGTFLGRPGIILLLLVFVLLLCFCALFEIGAVLAARHTHSAAAILSQSVHMSVRALRPQNILLIPYLLFFAPFFNLGMTPALLTRFRIPPYWIDTLQSSPFLSAVTAMLLISLFVLYFKKLKTIPLILTKDQSFLQAWKASSIDKKTVIRLLAAQLLFGLCQMMCTIAKGFPLLYVFLWFFIENMLLAVSYSLLSENMPASIPDHQLKHQKAWNVFLVVLSAGTVVYGLRTMPVLIETAPLFSAHRGASKEASENTLAAFEAAKKQDADYIELDIRQAKDGTLFISHDDEFDQGVISEMDKEQIRALNKSMPTLDETLSWARTSGMKLIIEIKTEKDSFSPSLVRTLAGQIKEYGMEDRCYAASFGIKNVQYLKELDPQIRTIALYTFAYGNFSSLKDIDAISVEASTITPWLVQDAHKPVFAWTVNDVSEAKRLARIGVQNITTDDVKDLKKKLSFNE